MSIVKGNHDYICDEEFDDVYGFVSNEHQFDWGMHSHQESQLILSPSGCITVNLQSQKLVIPPNCAIWLPPKIQHSIERRGGESLVTLFFKSSIGYTVPNDLRVLRLNSLLNALIQRVSYASNNRQFHPSLIELLCYESYQAPLTDLSLPLPTDSRLLAWLNSLGEYAPQKLGVMAKKIGASEKTISRIFFKETGMHYQKWRKRWLLLKAIELLSEGESVTGCALTLDFSTTSAFIYFFKQAMHTTPSQYRKYFE